MLCGVRILDKSFRGKENFFRVEVWTKFADDANEASKKMKEYITAKVIPLIKDEPECKGEPTIRFSAHKTPSKSNNAGAAGANSAQSDYKMGQGKK